MYYCYSYDVGQVPLWLFYTLTFLHFVSFISRDSVSSHQVCNHVASMDDPLVMAALLPPRLFLQPKSLRWTLCATDRCFTNAAFSAFFHSVKVLPLKRGAGLQQEVLIVCAAC